MKIAISGSSGLIGTALIEYFSNQGHDLIRLVRKRNSSKVDVYWNYKTGEIDLDLLENTDVFIHLAGENVAGLWTESKKDKIRNSRLEGTQFLVNSVKKLKNKPKTFISASAIGIYGSRGSEKLNEESKPGHGFLAELAVAWENITDTLTEDNIRIINLRLGLVLSNKGGALQKMLLPFKIGLGGKIGSGKQFMSWIVIDDLVSAVKHISQNHNINGAVNLVSPTPVTNEKFTKSLGKVLNRPTIFSIPSFLLKSTVPEMADEMFLASTRVYPVKLLESGYKFRFDILEESLNYLLNE